MQLKDGGKGEKDYNNTARKPKMVGINTNNKCFY
jgi:hypothetical protein